jgi:hypothetical protein
LENGTPFDLVDLDNLQDLFGVSVDVVSERALHPMMKDDVLRELRTGASMRSPLLYLSEMLGTARTTKDFMQSMEKETFLKDEKTRSAVTHQLLVLGEASKAIPSDIKLRAPNLD